MGVEGAADGTVPGMEAQRVREHKRRRVLSAAGLFRRVTWGEARGRVGFMPRFAIAQLDALPAVGCPCGQARRAFRDLPGAEASVHLVDIKVDSETHHHQRTTEIYVVVEGEGELELDGVRVPVKPLTAVYIRPGCRHRAVGRMRLLNIPIPPFDPADEHIDTEEAR